MSDFEEKYFCAMNSGNGFFGFYGEMIGRADRVFVVKGGPGTGKSRFLREVGEAAEKVGGRAEYYYCSSDQSSLDAVIIDGKTLLLDGTAPHEVGTSIPGLRDNIVDLGAFWNVSSFEQNRDEIAFLMKRKSECYASAYDLLAAARRTTLSTAEIEKRTIDQKSIDEFIEKVAKELPDGEGFAVKNVVLDSYGMRGRVKFNTFAELSETYVSVVDTLDIAYLLNENLLELAKRKNISVTVARDPLIPERIDAILFDGVLFAVGRETVDDLCDYDMVDFLNKDEFKKYGKEIKKARKCRARLEELALERLADAAKYHFGLEKIYGDAMDFEGKEKFTKEFIETNII